ncbi:MAG: hypothetical protein KGL39_28200 [Patescibacteria group bacterium]|nr:hypothetical protein [Patescibacteria group bacterium]
MSKMIEKVDEGHLPFIRYLWKIEEALNEQADRLIAGMIYESGGGIHEAKQTISESRKAYQHSKRKKPVRRQARKR